MSDTSVKTAPAPGAAPAAQPPANAFQTPPAARPALTPATLAWKGLKLLASLRLTVVLFALSLVLVFFGTLAQIGSSNLTAVNTYFRSVAVWIPLQLLVEFGKVFLAFPRTWVLPAWVGFPFFGGLTLGLVLLVNLLAAHLVRFKVSWKRSGILILHAGLIVLLLGELVTAFFAVEGHMQIYEGASSNYVVHNHVMELAVVDPSVKEDGKALDDVLVIPGSQLHARSEDPYRPFYKRWARALVGSPSPDIHDPRLPFDIKVVRYMINSQLHDVKEGESNDADTGFGTKHVAESLPEVSGTATKQMAEAPSVYLELIDRETQKSLGKHLFSVWLKPEPVVVNGKTYQVSLRPKRTYKPFSLHLIEFRFDKYIGTETAKNYSSKVELKDPERNEDRELVIRMNEPLRYRGDTFYQADFDHDAEQYTLLQVVRNPGWWLPYLSCALVTFGMLIHFGIALITFLQRRAL